MYVLKILRGREWKYGCVLLLIEGGRIWSRYVVWLFLWVYGGRGGAFASRGVFDFIVVDSGGWSLLYFLIFNRDYFWFCFFEVWFINRMYRFKVCSLTNKWIRVIYFRSRMGSIFVVLGGFFVFFFVLRGIVDSKWIRETFVEVRREKLCG